LSNSLNAVEALHSKYEAIKAQLPGWHLNYKYSSNINMVKIETWFN
jgi:hypothetical protein